MSQCTRWHSDVPADILIINFRANEAFVIQIKFLGLFCEPTTLKFKLWLEFSVCYHLRIKNKLQYCNTVYCVFILFTVSARGHRNHVNLQNVFIHSLSASVFSDILIVKSSFNNPKCNYGVFWTLQALFRLNVWRKTEMM